MIESGNHSGGTTTTHTFTGDEHDAESTSFHTPFRQYSPLQARWTVPDPAGLGAVDPSNPQSWNRYAYVSNNPMSNTDPAGTFQCPWWDDECGTPCSPFDISCSPAECMYDPFLCVPPPTGGGGGGGGSVPAGPPAPTPIPEAPTNVGVPDDTGMGTGPIWTEKIPISSGPYSPYLIIQNFIGRDANGNWLGIPCPFPKVGDWIDENSCLSDPVGLDIWHSTKQCPGCANVWKQASCVVSKPLENAAEDSFWGVAFDSFKGWLENGGSLRGAVNGVKEGTGTAYWALFSYAKVIYQTGKYTVQGCPSD